MRGLMPLLVLGMGCAPERECTTTVWFVDDGIAQDVGILGDWTEWREVPLEEAETGAWTLTLALPAGEHAYQLVVDGRRQTDPMQPLLSVDPVTGAERSMLRVGDCDSPVLEVEDADADAAGAVSAELTFLRAPGGPRLDADAVSASAGPVDLDVSADPASGRLGLRGDGLSAGKHTITVRAGDRDGGEATLQFPLWVEPRPFAWEDALVYQVMVDRFADGAGGLPALPEHELGARAGGTLAGVRRALDAGYFDALGANVLWLGPVQPNPAGDWVGRDGEWYSSYHGYWPIARTGVDPRLGTEEELRELVSAAHGRGMRVLLDVVPNHVHEQHPWASREGWVQGAGDCICGADDCAWAGNIETCWFTPYLPDLDWSRPAVADAVTGDLVAWARDMDLDGLRVDAVPMMPRAAVRHIVSTVREELEAGPTRFFLLGETFTGPGETATIRRNLGPHGLDGQFEFPVMWALRGYAAWRSADAADLARAIRESRAAWEGSGSVMSPFVGNHDVSRFLSEAAGDRTDDPWGAPPPQPDTRMPHAQLVLAQAIALTLPGMPVLWQGDELGLAGATDPDCRRVMPFDDALAPLQAWTLQRMQRIGRTRRCSRALRRGQLRSIVAEGAVYGHARDAFDGRPAVLLTNASDAATRVSVRIPRTLAIRDGLTFTDAIERSETVRFVPGATTTLTLPPWSARLFVPSDLDCLETP